jgi:hypothetical protein
MYKPLRGSRGPVHRDGGRTSEQEERRNRRRGTSRASLGYWNLSDIQNASIAPEASEEGEGSKKETAPRVAMATCRPSVLMMCFLRDKVREGGGERGRCRTCNRSVGAMQLHQSVPLGLCRVDCPCSRPTQKCLSREERR